MMNEVYWLFVRPKKQQSSAKRVVESIIIFGQPKLESVEFYTLQQ